MKLPLIRLGETLELVERMKGDADIAPPLRYKLSAIYVVLTTTSEILAPLLTGEWEEDKWIEPGHSLDFEGLTLEELESLPDLDPKTMRVLLRITKGRTPSTA